MKLMFLLVILIPGALFLADRGSIQRWAERSRGTLRKSFGIVCALIFALIVFLAFAVAFKDQALHDETTILSGAAAYLHGYPLYPQSSAPVEYGLLYGPATYLVYTPVLLPANHLTLPLLWAAMAFIAAIFVVFLSLRTRVPLLVTLGITVALVALLAPFLPYLLSTKGDAWIVLAMALGLPAARLRHKWIAALSIALLGAALTDLKFPLLLAGLLPCVMLWQRGKEFRAPAIVAAVLAPVLALAVFLLPGISMESYWEQVALASHHGLSPQVFLRILPFALYLLLPSICFAVLLGLRSRVALLGWAKSRAAYLVLLTGVFGVAIITGSKFGAGPWHLEVVCIPLVVLDAEMFTLLWDLGAEAGVPFVRVLAVPFALGVVLFGNLLIGWQRGIKARVRGPELYVKVSMPQVEREAIDILRAHPGESFSMGYTDVAHYNLTSVRPLLQERGMPTLIDPVTRNEDDLAGKPMNPAVVQAVATCVMPHWILPREGDPFSMKSLYYLDGSITTPEMYPQSLRAAFFSHYHRVSEGQYFAVWECNGQGAGGA